MAQAPLPVPQPQEQQPQEPQPEETVYISFSAEINPHTTESLLAVFANQLNAGKTRFCLMLSTPGGSVMNGLNLYNVLRGLPITLITHNVGNVDSIGNAIFLAGQTRYACAHSTFMFHGVAFNFTQGVSLDERGSRERLANILSDQKRIGSIIQERTTLTAKRVRSMFREARTVDSAFAVGSGIVHEIRDVQIPPGAPVYQLVFQR
jgi:ATP-dependent protease ClpP protease subunit